MFFIPQWVTLLVATLVSAFGLYRLYLGWISDPEKLKEKKGLYGLPKRTHGLFGILYLILGAFLYASGFGYNPFKGGEEAKKSQWIEIPQSGDKSSAAPDEQPDEQPDERPDEPAE